MADEPDTPTEPEPGKPLRVEGPTPNGGAYALVMLRPDGSVEIAECREDGSYIRSTLSAPRRSDGSEK